jgi:3-oxosteroid 1-dehydrogenase
MFQLCFQQNMELGVSWDLGVDFLIVGSGAAGLSAAIRAHELGLDIVVVEASDQYGGSTAISGGVVWIPDNEQLPSRGIADCREDALAYMRHITEGEVPEERLAAYVDHSKRMLAWMEANTHLSLDSLEAYCDYYPEAPGGKSGGRSMEPVPFDATKLGGEFARLRKPHPQSQVMGKFGITAREAHGYMAPTLLDKLKLVWRMVEYALRFFKRKGGRDTKLHAGNSLIARLRRSMMDRSVPLWLESPVRELVVEDGRVVGAVVERAGERLRVEARCGVLLAAGGFEQNQAMRTEHHSMGESRTEWNAGNPHNQGAGIRMGAAVGGQVTLMDDAWWTPVTRIPKSEPAWVLVVEKSLPGGIFVNKAAQRFVNEASPYLDVVKGMYAGAAVPVCWMIFDAEFRRLYPVGPIAPGYAMPDKRVSRRLKDGFLHKGKTLESLADRIGLDGAALRQTVDRFNEMAARGVDEDFGRGNSLADTYYGDPRVGTNASLRPLTHAPFYAIPVFPGDLGTKGGLITDPNARVLDAGGQVIPGLYAAGNCSASVMGGSYPGAGGTIGPALTFGFLAAESAASSSEKSEVLSA